MPRRGRKISVRMRIINICLFVLVLALIIIMAVIMATDVASRASSDLAFFYSLEAMKEFNSSISRDLALVQKVARSKAVTDWFADEGDQVKKFAAYNEMMDYIGLLNSAELYFGIGRSLNEYSIRGGSIMEFVPFDVILPDDPYNCWFFDVLSSDNEYAFNIDKDKVTHEWRLWINHKVVSGSEPVGVFCSGFQVEEILHSMFSRYKQNDVKGFVIDKHGLIQLDSDFNDYDSGKEDIHIHMESVDPAFDDFIDSYLAGIDGYFSPDSHPEVIKLSKGSYRFASVAPLTNSDWLVVTFYDSSSLFSAATLLPLVAMLISIFVLYTLASSAISRHFVLSPLNNLTASVSETSDEEPAISGVDRDDDIGELARTIQKAWHNISEAHQRMRLLLDATPLACRLMKMVDAGKYMPFECNEESVKLFKFKNKQDFMERYFEIYPECQPDGGNSAEEGQKHLDQAYNKGICTTNFLFQATDGTPIPSEVTLVRVKYGEEYVLAGYTRDLREHKRMMSDIQKRDDLLNVINRVAAIMLVATNEEHFEDSLIESMELIGRNLEADFVQIWPIEIMGGDLNFVLKYKWLSETGQKSSPVDTGFVMPYTTRWQELFQRGMCVNGPISRLPQEDRELLSPLGIKSTISIPLLYRGEFWGVFCVDDWSKERYYTEGEINLLHSAGLILVNAINRNAQAAQIREAHKRAQILLDATPLAVTLWDSDMRIFDCNEKAICVFKAKDKPEFLERFAELSPKFQPDGSLSSDLIPIYTGEAFRDGIFTFEWDHQALDGTPLPSEVTLVRVAYEGGYALAGYVRDLREYRQMMQEISESAIKLEEALSETQRANDAKSDFLASMSHEMRTPLNAIIGLSGLSLENTGLDDETCSNLEKIYSSGDMLLNIVNDILDISKIEAGRMELVEVDYDVPSLINDTVTQNILRIGEKPVELKLNIGEDLFARLCGDELRVKQIMNNLLSNAIKYTREGMVELSVRCEQENDIVWVTIKVSDTGIGIRPEDMGKLFKDYSQLDLESNRKNEGTGLGLPIVKHFAELMGGCIEVESEYRKGSVFIVRIAQKFVCDIHIDRDVVKNLRSFRYSDNKRGRSVRLRRVSLPYARVLVVDDNLTNLEVAKGLMKPYGMQVDCVTGGQQSIDAIRAGKVRYNAIFMDHMMPELDGIETTRIIRDNIGTDYAKNIPIIALTANAIAGNEALFLSKGFQAFISKPIEIARLDEVIRRWVRDKDHEKRMLEKQKELIEGEAPPAQNVRLKQPGQDENGSAGHDPRDPHGMEISGLDAVKGIERFGGNRDMYFDILRVYITNTAVLLESIKNVGPDDLPEYAVTVHGMKGSSHSIGAEEIAGAAENLEKAAKAGDFEFVTANNPPFLASSLQLISDIDKMIKNIYPENPKPVKESPDRDLLKKLLDACKQFDTDEIEHITAELCSYEYKSDGDLVTWLYNSANQYKYKEIKEGLTDMFDKEEA